jgi:hypothetical protein
MVYLARRSLSQQAWWVVHQASITFFGHLHVYMEHVKSVACKHDKHRLSLRTCASNGKATAPQRLRRVTCYARQVFLFPLTGFYSSNRQYLKACHLLHAHPCIPWQETSQQRCAGQARNRAFDCESAHDSILPSCTETQLSAQPALGFSLYQHIVDAVPGLRATRGMLVGLALVGKCRLRVACLLDRGMPEPSLTDRFVVPRFSPLITNILASL